MIKKHFGTLPDGRQVDLFSLTNSKGMEVNITNYGATLTSIFLPTSKGKVDVIWGFDTLEGCLSDHPFMNTIIGRYGNRIAQASFRLDGKTYDLPANQAPHQLHGGSEGFDKKLWKAADISDEEGNKLKLTYLSPDGEMGFPGKLKAELIYALNDENELSLSYRAETDQPTIVNLTHHGYFNLSGKGDIKAHKMSLYCDKIVAAGEDGIPLQNALMEVEGTPFDFRKPASLGERLEQEHEQLTFGNGFDRSFVANDWKGELKLIAEVSDPETGNRMKVKTTEPAVQLYTANFLSNVKGKYGQVYEPYSAFCLEAQHFPDSPNRPDFPSTRLDKGEVYLQTTIYQFFWD
ncbi:MAG: aldose epimerase family protein [Bacteroidota bacterium]